MAANTCPALASILAANECQENFAGLAVDVYVGLKSDLAAPLKETDGVYTIPTSDFLKSGKNLYKFQCKEDSQQITGESLGRRKGFKITFNFVLEAVNAASAKVGRALNNLDVFFIVADGDQMQIVYDPNRKLTFDSGGIKTDTGAKAEDDRQVTCAGVLSPVKYPNLYCDATTETLEKLLTVSEVA